MQKYDYVSALGKITQALASYEFNRFIEDHSEKKEEKWHTTTLVELFDAGRQGYAQLMRAGKEYAVILDAVNAKPFYGQLYSRLLVDMVKRDSYTEFIASKLFRELIEIHKRLILMHGIASELFGVREDVEESTEMLIFTVVSDSSSLPLSRLSKALALIDEIVSCANKIASSDLPITVVYLDSGGEKSVGVPTDQKVIVLILTYFREAVMYLFNRKAIQRKKQREEMLETLKANEMVRQYVEAGTISKEDGDILSQNLRNQINEALGINLVPHKLADEGEYLTTRDNLLNSGERRQLGPGPGELLP